MKKILLMAVLLVTCFSIAANSLSQRRYMGYGSIRSVNFIRNYDGDTITVDIPGYPPIIGDDISIRINGIDTPEIRGKCKKEKMLAAKAKQQVKALLANAQNIELRNVRRGKYFRIVADVWVDGLSINQILINKNLAVPYNGGSKSFSWCD